MDAVNALRPESAPCSTLVLSMSHRLDGWKSIAKFFNRTVRTVQLWELHRGLPVRRLPAGVGSGNGSVYAEVGDLQGWLAQHGAALDEQDTEPAQASSLALQTVSRTDGLLVLPFEWMGSNADWSYVGPSFAQELLSRLCIYPLEQLRVMSWTTSRWLSQRRDGLQRWAQELGIRYVLEGHIQDTRRGWEVQVRLVDALHDQIVYVNRLRCPVKSLLQAQGELAAAVAEHLHLHVQGHPLELFWSEPVDVRASVAFMHACSILAEAPSPRYLQARDLLMQAQEWSPGYAPATAACIRAEMHLANYVPDKNRYGQYTQWKARLDACLSVAPHSQQVRYSQGFLVGWYEFDWSQAIAAFEKLIEHAPSDASSAKYLAQSAALAGDPSRASISAQRLAQVDQTPMALCSQAYVLQWQGRLAEAVTLYERALALDPLNVHARIWAIAINGMYIKNGAEARHHLDEAPPFLRARYEACTHAVIAASNGHTKEARHWQQQMIEQAQNGQAYWYQVALVDAIQGDGDRAGQFLQNAVDNKDQALSMALVDPALDQVRDHPRVQEVLRMFKR